MSCIDKNNTDSFMKPLVLCEPAFVGSWKKQETYFSHGYFSSSIDLIADFYYKK